MLVNKNHMAPQTVARNHETKVGMRSTILYANKNCTHRKFGCVVDHILCRRQTSFSDTTCEPSPLFQSNT